MTLQKFSSSTQRTKKIILFCTHNIIKVAYASKAFRGTTDELLKVHVCKRKQFVDLFSTELGLQERFLEGLWGYFNKNGSDQVTISNIIGEIAVYEQQ